MCAQQWARLLVLAGPVIWQIARTRLDWQHEAFYENFRLLENASLANRLARRGICYTCTVEIISQDPALAAFKILDYFLILFIKRMLSGVLGNLFKFKLDSRSVFGLF